MKINRMTCHQKIKVTNKVPFFFNPMLSNHSDSIIGINLFTDNRRLNYVTLEV